MLLLLIGWYCCFVLLWLLLVHAAPVCLALASSCPGTVGSFCRFAAGGHAHGSQGAHGGGGGGRAAAGQGDRRAPLAIGLQSKVMWCYRQRATRFGFCLERIFGYLETLDAILCLRSVAVCAPNCTPKSFLVSAEQSSCFRLSYGSKIVFEASASMPSALMPLSRCWSSHISYSVWAFCSLA